MSPALAGGGGNRAATATATGATFAAGRKAVVVFCRFASPRTLLVGTVGDIEHCADGGSSSAAEATAAAPGALCTMSLWTLDGDGTLKARVFSLPRCKWINVAVSKCGMLCAIARSPYAGAPAADASTARTAAATFASAATAGLSGSIPTRLGDFDWNDLASAEGGTRSSCVEVYSLHPSARGQVLYTLQCPYSINSLQSLRFTTTGRYLLLAADTKTSRRYSNPVPRWPLLVYELTNCPHVGVAGRGGGGGGGSDSSGLPGGAHTSAHTRPAVLPPAKFWKQDDAVCNAACHEPLPGGICAIGTSRGLYCI